ncbi:MAG: hypothetical protein Q9M32_02695 [Sulfurimonas sp.]|nr:hypothetical protein [Sulfurimonas sp.]
MIRLLVLLLGASACLFADFEVSGHADLESQVYKTQQDNKNSNSFTLKQVLEVEYAKEDLSLFSKVYAQAAYHDFLNDVEDTGRTFARLDELYLKYELEDSSIKIGKSIRFWGSLELENIVDVFNPNELQDDLFATNPLGVWNASYSYYTDSGELSIVVKVNEPNQKMANYPYVYYVFPQAVLYDETLKTSKNKNQPSVYLSYNGTTDAEYALDFAFIYEHGYDSQRYFSQTAPTSYVQNAYIVDKFMTYNTLVIGNTLLKLEALYAIVDDAELISDYSHIAVGVEHAFADFEDGSTLGFLYEYYKYTTYEDNKYTDLELFQSMQDDLFVGLRYALNNADATEFVGGIVHDLEYDEQTYYGELNTRLGESLKLTLDYYYIEPSKKELTAYALLGRHQRMALSIAYYY